jgi:hypothetical protein
MRLLLLVLTAAMAFVQAVPFQANAETLNVDAVLARRVHVRGYTRHNGTHVTSRGRRSPHRRH